MSSALRIGAASTVCEGRALYDPIRGGQVVNVYEGDATGVNALIASLQVYERYELDNSNAPIYRLTVYSPAPDDAPVWELLANLKEKDIYEHPTFATVSDDNIAAIQNFLRKPTVGAYPVLTGGTGALALRLYQLLLKGTKKYFTEEYVLRYTITATNAVMLNLAYAYTDRVFTPAQLATPGTSGITLPVGISTSIGNIPAKTPPSAQFVWGWLKRAPTSRQTTIGKVVVTGEWWLDLWNVDLYPPV